MLKLLTCLVVLLVSLTLSNANTLYPAITPVVLPAVQTSVASTAFNPAETNAGGTTNSAGTFDVVSLAQSTSYSYDSSIPQTTSFVITSPNFAPSASEVTPSYGSITASGTNLATSSKISLISSVSGISSIQALTTVAGNSDAAIMSVSTPFTWTLLLSGGAAVIGALFVL